MRLKLASRSKPMDIASNQQVRVGAGSRGTVLVLLEVLNFLLVLLGLFEVRECAKISPFARRLFFLARIQPVLAGLELANHTEMDARGQGYVARRDTGEFPGRNGLR
jgi:hypothetical protein